MDALLYCLERVDMKSYEELQLTRNEDAALAAPGGGGGTPAPFSTYQRYHPYEEVNIGEMSPSNGQQHASAAATSSGRPKPAPRNPKVTQIVTDL